MVGRFINADDVSLLTESEEDLTDKNLYAYCDNNPINRSDDEGEIWNFVAGTFGGALIGAAISIGKQVHSGKKLSEISWKKVGKSALSGALVGASIGSGIGGVARLATKGAIRLASRHWAGNTAKERVSSLTYHYNKHVVKEGLKKKVSVRKYTKDALKFAKRNSKYLKYTRPNKPWHRPGWKGRYTKGNNGWFTSSGKIITFWYK